MRKKIVSLILIIFVTMFLVSCNKTEALSSSTICSQMNSIIEEYEASGHKKEIEDKWYSLSEEGKDFDFSKLTGENGTLNVGIIGTYEPFTYETNQTYSGLSIEYVYDLCMKYGYDMNIISYTSMSGLLAAIQSGKVDIGAGPISATEERMESVCFSTPFFDNEIICIVNDGDNSIKSKDDLKGKRVGVISGNAEEIILPKDCPEAISMGFNGQIDVVLALESNQIDCAYTDKAVFKYVQITHPNLVEAFASQSDDHYAFVFQKFGYQSTNELKGKTIGLLEGSSIYSDLIEEKIEDADTSIYKDIPSLIEALKNKKIDSFVSDKALVKESMKENSDIYTLYNPLYTAETGTIFSKTTEGYNRKKDFDDFISELQESGKLEELVNKWENYTEDETKLESVSNIESGETLNVSICATMSPYCFYEDGCLTGLEIDLINLYASKRGLKVKYENMEWNALMTSLSKNDMAISCIIKTEEREESVYFSTTLYTSDVVLVSMVNNAKNDNFFEDIGNSFYKTFVKEERYKLFLEGVEVTLLITVSSIIIGLVFGFLLHMLSSVLGEWFKVFIKGISAVLNYIPVVVILMIFYYILFGNSRISNIVVSIIVFSIMFSLTTYSLITTCLMAIDKGQYEAAYVLGYSKSKTFFKVIIPQILPQFLSLFKNEVVSHLKATAIVGYIAVEDLTKMSDIVRSRTYESFFPLIATALIYFVLAFLLIALVKRINICIDPKKRSEKRILKGVEDHD